MSTRTLEPANYPRPGNRWWREVIQCHVCKGRKIISVGLLRRQTAACHNCGGTGEVEVNKWYVAPAICLSIALLVVLMVLSNGGV